MDENHIPKQPESDDTKKANKKAPKISAAECIVMMTGFVLVAAVIIVNFLYSVPTGNDTIKYDNSSVVTTLYTEDDTSSTEDFEFESAVEYVCSSEAESETVTTNNTTVNQQKTNSNTTSKQTASTKAETVAPAKKDTTSIVNINTASLEQLMTLKGIGEVKANAIISYRQTSGGFKSVDELTNVKGIGSKTLEKIRARITV